MFSPILFLFLIIPADFDSTFSQKNNRAIRLARHSHSPISIPLTLAHSCGGTLTNRSGSRYSDITRATRQSEFVEKRVSRRDAAAAAAADSRPDILRILINATPISRARIILYVQSRPRDVEIWMTKLLVHLDDHLRLLFRNAR